MDILWTMPMFIRHILRSKFLRSLVHEIVLVKVSTTFFTLQHKQQDFDLFENFIGTFWSNIPAFLRQYVRRFKTFLHRFFPESKQLSLERTSTDEPILSCIDNSEKRHTTSRKYYFKGLTAKYWNVMETTDN